LLNGKDTFFDEDGEEDISHHHHHHHRRHNSASDRGSEDHRTSSKTSLKIDKNLVPVDLRLHSYLSTLAKACPCPCSVGSRDMTISELSADSLEDLHIQVLISSTYCKDRLNQLVFLSPSCIVKWPILNGHGNAKKKLCKSNAKSDLSTDMTNKINISCDTE